MYVSTSSADQPVPGGSDPAPRPSRRAFSPEFKLRILAEYENAPHGEKAAVLRREGLYSSHLIEWARARDAGALTGSGSDDSSSGSRRPVRKTAEQIELGKLRRQNEKLQADLKKTRMALDIMGKHTRSWKNLRERGQRSAAEQILTTALTDLRSAGIAVQRGCELTGPSRATHYRRRSGLGPVHGPWLPRTRPPSALSDTERVRILDVLNSTAYADLAIPQVWARELDEGPVLVLPVDDVSHRPHDRAGPQTTPAGHPPAAGASQTGRDRPVAGVVVGHHRVQRTGQRRLVSLLRGHRHLLPLRDRVARRGR
ncbi:transposase [Micromonospora sp. MH33]|uniref:transposase n=1 Tax=Micromonospora sp. MH33 TaxID=1945509 RepID=UPI00143CDB82|nr:transposase [Micromonospora sp. MH33]